MFSVGRYDPRAAEAAEAKKNNAAKRRKTSKENKKKTKRQEKRDDAKISNNVVGSTSAFARSKDKENKTTKMTREKKKLKKSEATTTTTRVAKKRKIHNAEESDSNQLADDPQNSTKIEINKDTTTRCDGDENENDDGNSLDTNSSSSVPFSSSDEGDSDNDAKIKPAFSVIAPEQKQISTAGIQQKTTDEGIDDFDDVDETLVDDLVEAAASSAQPLKKDAKKELRTTLSSQNEEIKRALTYSTAPILAVAQKWNLAPFLIQNLLADKFQHFFPIQCMVIPDVIASERNNHVRPRDVCVSAPTGSGKTLGFVLPVLNSLAQRRVVRRLRALVVLPSRDLASQVYNVFDRYVQGSDLRVGLAIGQKDFETEQKSLVLGGFGLSPAETAGSCHPSVCDHDAAQIRHALDPTNVRSAMEIFENFTDFNTITPGGKEKKTSAYNVPRAGQSAVDVLVATPGRLMDHIEKTPGFTLQHLRFLVIDEADRLVNQSYQNWIGRVMRAALAASTFEYSTGGSRGGTISNDHEKGISSVTKLGTAPDGTSFVLDPITWRKGGMDGTSFDTNATNTASYVPAAVCQTVPLRKLLFSATLTKDPQKLASLGLVNPKHFDAHRLNVRQSNDIDNSGEGQQSTIAQQRYSVPEHLSEYMIECTAQQKPLVLLALLLEHQKKKPGQKIQPNGIIVVFTSSIDSTHRLTRLLQILWGSAGFGPTSSIAEFSSALTQKQRARLLQRCTVCSEETATPITHRRKKKKQQQQGEEDHDQKEPISVVVCSDGMSRGMDIPSVSAVINYDVPRFAKTYVHRCGRTARAGRKGKAISVLKGGQIGKFLKMRQLIDHPDRVNKTGVQKDLVQDVVPMYQSCMRNLHRVMEAENNGELETIMPLNHDWLATPDRSSMAEYPGTNKSGESSSSGLSSSESELSTEDESD